MKANELRIGNWVTLRRVSTSDPGWTDTSLLIHNESMLVELFKRNLDTPPFTVLPIALTPEILEKCGFKKIYYTGLGLYEYHHPDLWNSLDSVGGGWNIEDNRCGWVLKQHIKYVHQLQNLFFALTSEELNINL